MTVLGESIDHHVKEEEDEMFPRAKKAKLDLAALGAEILKRRQELQASGRASAAKKKASVAKPQRLRALSHRPSARLYA